jgi:hypothetical protein
MPRHIKWFVALSIAIWVLWILVLIQVRLLWSIENHGKLLFVCLLSAFAVSVITSITYSEVKSAIAEKRIQESRR